MSDYFDRVERQIVRRVQDGVPRASRLPIRSGHFAVAAAAAVVVVVAGVFLLARSGISSAPTAPAAAGGATITFTPSPSAAGATIDRTVQILHARLAAAIPGARVAVSGGQIVVTPPSRASGVRAEILALAAPGRLAFYDWEGNTLAPNGKTVGGQLPSPDPNVLAISQGDGSAAPGELGAGCMPLQQALALANRLGAGTRHTTEYLGAAKLRVPAGYIVIEAAGGQPGRPTDGYFVLRNRPALTQAVLTNPQQSRDRNSGAPDVTFGFTAAGRRSFQSVTAAVARRGSMVSGPGQTLNQHFAIAMDNQLLIVPFIDFRQYPDGISGDHGADISANFTKRSAQDLAILLRYGPLQVNLTAAG